MNAHMAVQPSPLQDWFAPYRSTAIETYGLQIQPISKPVVVYIDRTRHVRPFSCNSIFLSAVLRQDHLDLVLCTLADLADMT